jgi:hypothetical protein
MTRVEQENSESSANWVDSLGKYLQNSNMKTALLEGHERFLLIAKARWLFVGFVAVYGACAGVGYILSDFGWFLSTSQFVGLVVGVLLILTYNAIYYVNHKQLARLRYSAHLQVLLDYLGVSLLIHLSGGVASWFWPVYLLVTFEQIRAHSLCYALARRGSSEEVFLLFLGFQCTVGPFLGILRLRYPQSTRGAKSSVSSKNLLCDF